MSDQITYTESEEPIDGFTGFEGTSDALAEKLGDAMTPGFEAECSPLEAERAGAFREDAMSESDARDSVAEVDTFDDQAPEVAGANVIVGAFRARNMSGKLEV